MAASKHNRASGYGTNPFFLELFRNLKVPDDRERIWHKAISRTGESAPPLRFPIYENLYLLNVYAQKIVDLLEELSNKFDIGRDYVTYHQSLIQYVRAAASESVANYMNGVEVTEEWLFDMQCRAEIRNLREEDDGSELLEERGNT